jgi:hypothetical protein
MVFCNWVTGQHTACFIKTSRCKAPYNVLLYYHREVRQFLYDSYQDVGLGERDQTLGLLGHPTLTH